MPKHVTSCKCGVVLVSSHAPLKHCINCYKSVPFPRLDISLDDVIECGRAGYTMKDTAVVLCVSYVQLRRVVARFKLRSLFPAWGASARWIAERGYAG